MGNRSRASWAGLVMVVGLVSPAMPAKAQGQTATQAWSPPRTPDGQPDLQGIWLSKSATPLERPKALEGRSRLTDEEVAELKARANRLFSNGSGDFAAGDGVFLAALANPKLFKSPTATHGSEEMIEREFDHHTSLVVDPPDGRIPPLTPEAQRRREAAAAAARRAVDPEDLGNALRCIAWGVPRLGGRYGAGDLGYYQILQTPGYVVLYMETGHEARIIPLDGRPHLPGRVGQWSGVSRGRWDGTTLVIETTSFSPKSNFLGSTEGLQLVERLTRVAPDTIKYEMTLTDPATWTQPWTAEMPLKQTDQMLYEYACHEGNYHILTGMLSAARAEEKAAGALQK
jgi:hypothetical protein